MKKAMTFFSAFSSANGTTTSLKKLAEQISNIAMKKLSDKIKKSKIDETSVRKHMINISKYLVEQIFKEHYDKYQLKTSSESRIKFRETLANKLINSVAYLSKDYIDHFDSVDKAIKAYEWKMVNSLKEKQPIMFLCEGLGTRSHKIKPECMDQCFSIPELRKEANRICFQHIDFKLPLTDTLSEEKARGVSLMNHGSNNL